MLRTGRSPLRHLWRALYLATARAAAVWLARKGGTIYLTGSLAHGEPLYGLSDLDLVAVSRDQDGRKQMERDLARLYRAAPTLRRLMAHTGLYDRAELDAVTSSTFLTYGCGTGEASFLGAGVRDPMILLERPGLGGPARDWRRLRGPLAARPIARTRQDERIAAWLELQHRWKLAYSRWADPPSYATAAGVATLLAEIARIWLWLVAGEDVTGRRGPLERAACLLEDERQPLPAAVSVLERLPRCQPLPAAELWSSYLRLSERIARCIGEELRGLPVRQVELDGDPLPRGLSLRDWPGLALPRVSWTSDGLATVPLEFFDVVGDNAAELAAVVDAACAGTAEYWPSLRSGPLLLRPSREPWGRGRLRGLEIQASDPVSFALAAGETAAPFPEVSGWSARDRALRSVAEHRAWLHEERDEPELRPSWVGARPLATEPTPASVSLLLSAARAALFLDTVEEGPARLTLTDQATVAALAAGDPAAAEPGEQALAYLRDRDPQERPDPAMVMRLRAAVIRLRAFASA